MNNLNEYVGSQIAKNYLDDRQQYEESRCMLKQTRVKRPGRIFCVICRSLVEVGHILVALGSRLERLDLVLRQSRAL